MEKTILFADFDGTLTMEDTLAGAMRFVVGPEEYAYYGEKLAKGEVTLSFVVRLAFEGKPSEKLGQMLDYVDTVPFRPGFETLLDTCGELGIPIVVISGGMRQFVERKLKPYKDRIAGIHSAELDTSGPEMRLLSQYDDGNELIKKTDVMALYEYDHAIGIGDSFTDMNMAQAVDTVFARDVLAKFLTKLGRPFTPYEDLFSVAADIRSSR